ncbi:MAG: glycine cleavage system protein GcvH [Proteobacteria bacterium]|nr:glycine cleavage system protein GcvH [Pseudomonadota bacterium]
MNLPDDLKYTKEHEWIKEDGNILTIGITDYAQDSLGDIVYLELPEDGTELAKDDTFGVVESVKAVSDLYSPVAGTITEVNDALVDSPEIINDDPYGEAWMIKVQVDGDGATADTMTGEAYKKYVEEEL